MIRLALALVFLLSSSFVQASDEKPPANPSFEYDVARTHELKPHRRTVPMKGVQPGFNQLHLTITALAPGSYGGAEFVIWSSLQNTTHTWWGFVGN